VALKEENMWPVGYRSQLSCEEMAVNGWRNDEEEDG